MQTREKKLAIGLGAAVAAWFGLPLFEGVFLSPLNDVNERLLGAKTSLEAQETLQLGLLKSTKALKQAAGIYDTIHKIFEISRKEKIPTYEASNRLAEERIGRLGHIRNIYAGNSDFAGRLGDMRHRSS